MESVIDSVNQALENKNWYAALFVALTLPDICVSLEHGKTKGELYANWFEQNLPSYKNYLSGNDCYALRCALLHQGKDNILEQKKRDVLEHYVFLAQGSHQIRFENVKINENTVPSFLTLNVEMFCRDVCAGVRIWLENNSTNFEISNRLTETIHIYENGYNANGIQIS